MHKNRLESMKGFTLIEVLIAAALMFIIGIALLNALGGASKVLLKADSQETARDLAQAQMEDIQKQDYDRINSTPTYTPFPTIPPGYSGYTIEISAERIDKDEDATDDDGLQKITVTVQGGDGDFTLEGQKVDW